MASLTKEKHRISEFSNSFTEIAKSTVITQNFNKVSEGSQKIFRQSISIR